MFPYHRIPVSATPIKMTADNSKPLCPTVSHIHFN